MPREGMENVGGKLRMKEEREDRSEKEMESEAADYRGFGK